MHPTYSGLLAALSGRGDAVGAAARQLLTCQASGCWPRSLIAGPRTAVRHLHKYHGGRDVDIARHIAILYELTDPRSCRSRCAASCGEPDPCHAYALRAEGVPRDCTPDR